MRRTPTTPHPRNQFACPGALMVLLALLLVFPSLRADAALSLGLGDRVPTIDAAEPDPAPSIPVPTESPISAFQRFSLSAFHPASLQGLPIAESDASGTRMLTWECGRLASEKRRGIAGVLDGPAGPPEGRGLHAGSPSQSHTSGPLQGWSVHRDQDACGRTSHIRIRQGAQDQFIIQLGYHPQHGTLQTVSHGGFSHNYTFQGGTGRPLSLTRGGVLTSNWSWNGCRRRHGHSAQPDRGNETTRRGSALRVQRHAGNGTLASHQTTGSTAGAFTYNFTYNFTYDFRLRRVARTASIGTSWTQLGYDAQDRLTSAHLSNARNLSYSYDAVGNCPRSQTRDDLRDGFAPNEPLIAAKQWTATGGWHQGGQRDLSPNALNQIVQIQQPRQYGIVGKVAQDATIELWHPAADPDQFPPSEILQTVPVGQHDAHFFRLWTYEGPEPAPLLVPVLVRGTLEGEGHMGTDAIADVLLDALVPAAQQAVSYDAAGNVTSDGEWTLGWDPAGNLVQMTRNPALLPVGIEAETHRFTYDLRGRRTQWIRERVDEGPEPVEERTTTETRRMLWDDWLPVMEEWDVNGGPMQRRYFVWGLDLTHSRHGAAGIGGLLAIVEEGANGRVLLPIHDGHGNITAVVNAANGHAIARYDYGPFGEPLGAIGDTDASPFGYQSKYWHPDLQLSYFGHRYYQPRHGRWISRDPIGEAGGWNLYGYCENDPVGSWDYLGLSDSVWDKIWSGTKNQVVYTGEVVIGFAVGFYETGSEIGDAILHPIRTARGIGRGSQELFQQLQDEADFILDHPLAYLENAGAHYYQTANSLIHAPPRELGKAGSGFAFDLVGFRGMHRTVIPVRTTPDGPTIAHYHPDSGTITPTSAGIHSTPHTRNRGDVDLSIQMADDLRAPQGPNVHNTAILRHNIDPEYPGGVGPIAANNAAPQLALPFKPRWTGVVQPYKKGAMNPIEHIMYRHGPQSGFSGVGRFAEGTGARQIKAMVDEAATFGTTTFQSSGRGGIVHDFGRQIGTHMDGSPATRLQVFFNEAGEVMTAFPIK